MIELLNHSIIESLSSFLCVLFYRGKEGLLSRLDSPL